MGREDACIYEAEAKHIKETRMDHWADDDKETTLPSSDDDWEERQELFAATHHAYTQVSPDDSHDVDLLEIGRRQGVAIMCGLMAMAEWCHAILWCDKCHHPYSFVPTGEVQFRACFCVHSLKSRNVSKNQLEWK